MNRFLRARCSLSLAVGLTAVFGLAGPASAASARPRIDTVVTTTLPVFEFTTYFDPPRVNISCEIDHDVKRAGAPSMNEAYCTSTSARLTHHATVSATGLIRTCVGPTCGSNAGLGTPSFAPYTLVRSGPFSCYILPGHVRCQEHAARGFDISATMITPIA